MREILFRSKHHWNDEWTEGYLCKNIHDEFCIQPISDMRCSFVREDTIGQYTGLKDTNNKPIFEGDIIRFCAYAYDWQDESEWDIKTGVIKYEDGGFIIDDICSSDGYNQLSCVYNEIHCGGSYDEYTLFEVIGNIHDNSELLKGE